MLIDAHNHPNWHGYDARRILNNMDEQGIDRMWLFTWEVPEDEYDPSYHKALPPGGVGIPLEDVLQVGREAPDRFVLGYFPHPKRPDAADRLRAAHEIHGIRVASEMKVRVLFDDPDAIRLYNACAEMKLPITIHLDYPINHGRGSYPRPNYWYGGSIEAFRAGDRGLPGNDLYRPRAGVLGAYLGRRPLRQTVVSGCAGASRRETVGSDAPVR